MPSAIERVIAFHIARLKDKSAEVRLKSIHELELLEAVEAFGPLEELYRSESDPQVKEAARLLGRKLYRKMHAQKEQGGGAG